MCTRSVPLREETPIDKLIGTCSLQTEAVYKILHELRKREAHTKNNLRDLPSDVLQNRLPLRSIVCSF